MTADIPISTPGDFTEDAFLGGKLKLRQHRRGHRAGHDAILLAAATPARSGDRVVEFGAGAGVAGLAVAYRVGDIHLTLVEIDPALVELAQNNAASNGIAARSVELDVGAAASVFETAGLPPDSADAVLMNPPFHGADRHRASPDAARQIAHMDPGQTLETWVHAARRVLVPSGRLTVIWRADELARVTAALERGFGGLEIYPIYARVSEPAIRIIVRATKGSRAPLRIFRGLVLNDETGQPTPEARTILEGAAMLPCP
jgi:tRNA1(Val) A37 N6-methylase TrmN6